MRSAGAEASATGATLSKKSKAKTTASKRTATSSSVPTADGGATAGGGAPPDSPKQRGDRHVIFEDDVLDPRAEQGEPEEHDVLPIQQIVRGMTVVLPDALKRQRPARVDDLKVRGKHVRVIATDLFDHGQITADVSSGQLRVARVRTTVFVVIAELGAGRLRLLNESSGDYDDKYYLPSGSLGKAMKASLSEGRVIQAIVGTTCGHSAIIAYAVCPSAL